MSGCCGGNRGQILVLSRGFRSVIFPACETQGAFTTLRNGTLWFTCGNPVTPYRSRKQRLYALSWLVPHWRSFISHMSEARGTLPASVHPRISSGCGIVLSQMFRSLLLAETIEWIAQRQLLMLSARFFRQKALSKR